MARLIKEWMKAKKGICSSDCECLTITGWKCYAEENLCNCGYKSNSNSNSNSNDDTNNNQSTPVTLVEPDTTDVDNSTDSTDNYVEPEIPDNVLENPTEESLNDLNS